LLLALVLSACCFWAFVAVAVDVADGGTHSFDTRLLLSLRAPGDASDPLGPIWLEEMARDVTGLGSAGILTFLTLASAGFLVLQRKRRVALYLLLASGSGILLSSSLKAGFDRPRPDLVPHGTQVYTGSFPSGHSMMATLVFITIGAVLAGSLASKAVKAYLLFLSVLLALSVGISRVYLGVHWPTDVLGGWAAGAGWALLCWALAGWLRSHGSIE
jgi:undecaprenyl-diphosphatase